MASLVPRRQIERLVSNVYVPRFLGICAFRESAALLGMVRAQNADRTGPRGPAHVIIGRSTAC